MSNILVLIDNGHGIDTKGKRSPDNSLQEYRYCRDLARELSARLQTSGIESIILVPEDRDIPLRERCNRANALAASTDKHCVLVSLHCNAAGMGQSWLNASGWQACVYSEAGEDSKRLASCLAKSAESKGLKVRRSVPNQDYWAMNLAICRDTIMPAVLTENLFMDNKKDVAFLNSLKGFETIVDLHYQGILNYTELLL